MRLEHRITLVARRGAAAAGATSLRALRRRAGLTQGQLGAQCGHAQSVVSRWERGVLEPLPGEVAAIAAAVGADAAAVLAVLGGGGRVRSRSRDPILRKRAGAVVRAARTGAGLEPYELSVRTGIRPSRLRRIEAGADCSMAELRRLGAALGPDFALEVLEVDGSAVPATVRRTAPQETQREQGPRRQRRNRPERGDTTSTVGSASGLSGALPRGGSPSWPPPEDPPMPRYLPDAKPGYEPVDYDAILERLRRLDPPPDERTMAIAGRMVRRTRTGPSAESYAQELRFYLRWLRSQGLDPFEVTEDDVDCFRASIARYAQGTQHLKLLVARLFYRRAAERGWVSANPVVIPATLRRTPETNTPALTKAQTERLLSAIHADFDLAGGGLTARRDYALVTLMVRLALRCTETTSLRWGRISESDGRRRVSFKGKGNKPAYLVVPDDVFETLLRWRHAFERETGCALGPGDPVFVGVSTRDLKRAAARTGASPLPCLSRGTVNGIVTGRMADVGLVGARYSPHALRATGAVLAYNAGATLVQVQELLRHGSVDTSMRYLNRIIPGASTAAIDSIVLDVPAWADEVDGSSEPGAA